MGRYRATLNLTESIQSYWAKKTKVDSACCLLSVSQAVHDSLAIQPSVKAKQISELAISNNQNRAVCSIAIDDSDVNVAQ